MPELRPYNWNSYFYVDKRYRNMICIRLLKQVTKHQFILLSKRYLYHGLQDASSKFKALFRPTVRTVRNPETPDQANQDGWTCGLELLNNDYYIL